MGHCVAPSPRRQEALQVLSRGDQQPVDVGVVQPPPPQPAQPLPGLALGKQGLDSDLSLAHRLLVGLGGLVAPHPPRYAA